jgi:hypothetical protein
VVVNVAVANPPAARTVTFVNPFCQVPIDVANVTLQPGDAGHAPVGGGMATVTASASVGLVVIETDVGLGMAGADASWVSLIAKMVAAGETVPVVVAVDPTEVAVTVAVPLPPATPETVVENLPALSVVPDVGLTLTTPGPVVATETGAPATTEPAPFLAIKVTIAGDDPSSGTVKPPPENTSSVEPDIWTGIWAVTVPAVAVIVAVRLAWVAVPEWNVTVPWPLAPVVTVWASNTPVSVPNVTVTPGTTAFVELSGVTVIVVVTESSDGMLVGEAASRTDAAFTAGVAVDAVVPVEVVATDPPPPPPPLSQPAITAKAIANKARVHNLQAISSSPQNVVNNAPAVLPAGRLLSQRCPNRVSTMRGVMNTSNSVLLSRREVFLNRVPTTGKSPKNGTCARFTLVSCV